MGGHVTLLVLLARSHAEPGALLKAAADEWTFAAELVEPGAVARPVPSPLPSVPPLPAPALPPGAGAARLAIDGASAALAKSYGFADAGAANEAPGEAPGSSEADTGLSAEVAALVKAAKAKEWRPEPPEAAGRVDQSAFLRREAHRRWQVYLKMAAHRLEAARTGDAVEEYHLIYEVVNQLIAGLQLAAEASQGRGSELSQGFAHVARLLSRLDQRSRGTPFDNEDFASQSHAAMALGCGNRPFEDRLCDAKQQRRWMESHGGPWTNRSTKELAEFQQSWLKYLHLGFAKGLWRKVSDHHAETFNPSDVDEKRSIWQIFPTYIMATDLREKFSWQGRGCRLCRRLTSIVLDKYEEFKDAGFADPDRPDEVNNAFFSWQLTHHSEQMDAEGQALWPELYGDSFFAELKALVKMCCVEYLQELYSSSLSTSEMGHLELSIWASVTSPNRAPSDPSFGLAFHDHPLSLVSGVFYADAGGDHLAERTPTVFADPRGVNAFRYASASHAAPEPMAPFHRLAYSHAKTGMSLVFPSWLVHGVAPHQGPRHRVVFAYNLHSSPGSNLASWAKTTL